ncbi:MAG TPA: EAL domain-containing protein [Candidatus Dormibacteraeota bacterium]|nr:EAL domain-containing protein [Candidatus Dormibacteraeota bacterium]
MQYAPHRSVYVVSDTAAVPTETLTTAVFAGGAELFGVLGVEDVAVGPAGTVILTVSHLHGSGGLGARTIPLRALRAHIAAHLSGAGHPRAGVEVAKLGTTATSGPFRELIEHWVDHLNDASTVTAVSRSFATYMTDLIANDAIQTLFQPIVETATGRVVGYEALSRGLPGAPLQSAAQLLDAGRQGGMEAEVMVAMAQLARRRAVHLLSPPDALLFINMGPAALWRPLHALDAAGSEADVWPVEQTVVEVTEHAPVTDAGAFLADRDSARAQGVRFALDDAGAGYAGLTTLALLAPDFIKIDMGIVRGCDRDPLKCSIIDALLYLAEHAGATVIAEGVETQSELAALRGLGVSQVQGFLIAEPTETPERITATSVPRALSGRPLRIPAAVATQPRLLQPLPQR